MKKGVERSDIGERKIDALLQLLQTFVNVLQTFFLYRLLDMLPLHSAAATFAGGTETFCHCWRRKEESRFERERRRRGRAEEKEEIRISERRPQRD